VTALPPGYAMIAMGPHVGFSKVTEGWEMFEGRAAIGYDHGYDAQKFYLGLALDPKYVAGSVEGCLERMGEDVPENEALFRDLWEDEGERETVLTILQAECEVLPGRPEDYFPY
jgi:hypothetical protein